MNAHGRRDDQLHIPNTSPAVEQSSQPTLKLMPRKARILSRPYST